MAKKNTYYFQHDSNAREDDKIVALRMDKGAAGYGIYWLLLELLSTSPDCEFERNYNKVGFVLHESAKDVKSVIEDYGLFQYTEDEQRFYSRRMTEQMEIINEMREKNSKKGKKGGNPNFQNGKKNPYYLKKDNPQDKPQVIFEDNRNGSLGNLQDKQSKEEESKEEESKENNNVSFDKETSSGSKPPDDEFDADSEKVGNERIVYRHLIEYWNKKTGGINGRLETIDNNRRKMTRARILAHGKARFKEAIDKASESDFLGKSKWFNYDWFIKPDNFDKIITGNYDNGNNHTSYDNGATDTRKHVTKPTGDGITTDF